MSNTSQSDLAKALDMDLDILAQQPGLSNLYTQISFCYSLPETSTHKAILETLEKGLERLSASFPWVAGQVIHEKSANDTTGVYKIKPLSRIPRVVVKDFTQDASLPTIDALRQARFPMHMLDETTVAPIKTLAAGSEEVTESSPVLAIQANFLTGGLLLTFAAQHNVMDMTGQGQIMRLLSKACHDEPFTSEELRTGNLERQNLIPLLDESYQPGPELAMQIKRPVQPDSTPTSTAPPEVPDCSWAYFTFSAESLTALKSKATETLQTGFISTDDALSAYIWQSVARARFARVGPTAETTFGRAVDPRRYLGIPETYAGLVQNMVYHTYPVQKLISENLGTVAAQFRSAVDPKRSKIGYNTRALTTQYYRASDRSTVGVTVNINPALDIMLSSWSKVDCYQLDFNLGLGKPECVRRPRFVPFESLMYLMPKAIDGEIAAAISLRNEDMERLKEDKEFANYATFIG